MARMNRGEPTPLRDDPRLPVALAAGVLLSSALWGWAFMMVAGLGLALLTVGIVAWRHQARGMQTGALWLSAIVLIGSLGLRLSYVAWHTDAPRQVTWKISGQADASSPAAMGQKRILIGLRLHPGHTHEVFSTQLATALAGANATLPGRFLVAHTVWGIEDARLVEIGTHKLCNKTQCTAGTIAVRPGKWVSPQGTPSPW
ncbi:MAG: hypothetical protein KC502_03750 [Myxococcales bacterium]|nr:hypothetical protein [Myxococcales bacterium]